ncbi:unnamed protein product [Meganyctiphanes norvegica]|uniref:Uncharacterized protein n=1 Tax=Meganyctiphanes norvegica TaxID=48144 RepID=A0AAV2QZZ4_MEGNR
MYDSRITFCSSRSILVSSEIPITADTSTNVPLYPINSFSIFPSLSFQFSSLFTIPFINAVSVCSLASYMVFAFSTYVAAELDILPSLSTSFCAAVSSSLRDMLVNKGFLLLD